MIHLYLVTVHSDTGQLSDHGASFSPTADKNDLSSFIPKPYHVQTTRYSQTKRPLSIPSYCGLIP